MTLAELAARLDIPKETVAEWPNKPTNRTTIREHHYDLDDPVLEALKRDTEPMLSPARDTRDTEPVAEPDPGDWAEPLRLPDHGTGMQLIVDPTEEPCPSES